MGTKGFNKILLFGGTFEGRAIAEFCYENEIPLDIRVATEYGKEVISHIEKENVFAGRLDETAIKSLLQEKKYTKVIDATHPYATLVTENIKNACLSENVEYIRLKRDISNENSTDILYFYNIEEAVSYLNNFDGIVFTTTGSKELSKFSNLNNLKERLVVRALPFKYSLKNCEEIGVLAKNIILMQGPFDYDLNLALMKKYKAEFLVTKQTGSTGGFDEKILAAKNLDMKILVILSEQENLDTGNSLDEVKEILLLGGKNG